MQHLSHIADPHQSDEDGLSPVIAGAIKSIEQMAPCDRLRILDWCRTRPHAQVHGTDGCTERRNLLKGERACSLNSGGREKFKCNELVQYLLPVRQLRRGPFPYQACSSPCSSPAHKNRRHVEQEL